jgi:putative aminopeptidase FrvX
MLDQRSLTFLRRLLDAPGPSGFEQAPARLWREEAKGFSQVEVDVLGNSFATLEGRGGPRVLLTGHADEIGLMIVHVDDDGFLHVAPIGGWDSQVLVGQRVVVLGRAGPVPGVVGKRPIHLIKKEDEDKVSKIRDLWLDIGARSKAEALERVRVGDAAVIACQVLDLPNGLITSRALDNRVGSFVALEALRRLAAEPPRAAVVALATTQEEISRTGGIATGAFRAEPQAAIVVDVTHAIDFPGAEKKEYGDVKLGGGPALARGSAVSAVVFEQLVAAAEAEKIPFALEAAPSATGTDADVVYTSRRGVATGMVSIPCRYMHSPNELVSLEDLDRAAALLAAWVRRLEPGTSFLPE